MSTENQVKKLAVGITMSALTFNIIAKPEHQHFHYHNDPLTLMTDYENGARVYGYINPQLKINFFPVQTQIVVFPTAIHELE
jgi:hypothetical protein